MFRLLKGTTFEKGERESRSNHAKHERSYHDLTCAGLASAGGDTKRCRGEVVTQSHLQKKLKQIHSRNYFLKKLPKNYLAKSLPSRHARLESLLRGERVPDSAAVFQHGG